MNLITPYGWTSPDPETVSYEFGEARYGTAPNDIPSNATGDAGGEDDKHLKHVDPDGPYGAAKVGSGLKSSYGGETGPDLDGEPPRDIGTIEIPFGHRVVEHGHQNYRDYHLVHVVGEDKYYVVIPNVDGKGSEYRSGRKNDRVAALSEAYRILSASLPDSALGQLSQRTPESVALPLPQ